MPRGFGRFNEYIRTLRDEATGELKLPLVAMNPMGKDHLLPFVERLLALAADGAASQVAAQVAQTLPAVPGDFRLSLVVADDLLGGWTNRYANELIQRSQPFVHRPRVWATPWITPLLWTSESYSIEQVRAEVATACYRVVHYQLHGLPHTLGELLAQEGYAMAHAGLTTPTLEAEDQEYTRLVLAPYLYNEGQPTLIAALFGDDAARQLGYTPLGLSPRAGLALALHDATRTRIAQI